MDLETIVDELDAVLRTEAYADIDASVNGLQIGPETGSVEHVAFAVDCVEATIEEAVDLDVDLLVVHHGLSWGGFERITDRLYERIAPLIDNDIALYVSHLPLDGHQDLGNAAGLADSLALTDREPFGSMEGEFLGQRGRLPDSTTIGALSDRLSDSLDIGDGRVRTIPFGPSEIRDIAIVTGAGGDFVPEAIDAGVDAFLTGEGKYHLYHNAREAGIHLLYAGHYATETFGVRALKSELDGWGLETAFIDIPTGF